MVNIRIVIVFLLIQKLQFHHSKGDFSMSITPAGEKFVYRRGEGWSSQEVRCLGKDKHFDTETVVGGPLLIGANLDLWRNERLLTHSVPIAIVQLILGKIMGRYYFRSSLKLCEGLHNKSDSDRYQKSQIIIGTCYD